jgi:hypothetical protein
MGDQPRVFVIHDQPSSTRSANGTWIKINKDLSAAEKFGTLIRVVPPGRHRLPGDQEAVISGIERVLEDIGPDDHLLPIGDAKWAMVCGALAAWNLGGQFRYLEWIPDSFDIDENGDRTRVNAHYVSHEMTIPSMLDPSDEDDDEL